MKLSVKDWHEFQHYTGRKPPWIKLHRSLLDNYEFHCLPDASRALAPMLWLIASESDDGTITCDLQKLAYRLRTSTDLLSAALKPLVDQGFIVDASGALAERKQVAMPEREGETETEAETEKDIAQKFEDFWMAYPRRKGKGQAFRAWRTACKTAAPEEILAGLARTKWPAEPKFIKHPATWLNGQCWLDEPDPLSRREATLETLGRMTGEAA